MSEIDTDIYAILPDLKPEAKECATQPRLLDSGLVVAGTLLSDRSDELLMRVMNPTPRQLRLKKGQQWPVEEVQVVERTSSGGNTAESARVNHTAEATEEVCAEEILSPLWTNVATDVPVEVIENYVPSS